MARTPLPIRKRIPTAKVTSPVKESWEDVWKAVGQAPPPTETVPGMFHKETYGEPMYRPKGGISEMQRARAYVSPGAGAPTKVPAYSPLEALSALDVSGAALAYGATRPKGTYEGIPRTERPEKAWEEYQAWEAPPGMKGAMELAISPIWFLPGGKVAKGVKLVQGTKALTWAGKQLAKGTTRAELTRLLTTTTKAGAKFSGAEAKSILRQVAKQMPEARATFAESPVITKLIKLIKEAKPVRKEAEALKSAELRRRVAAAATARKAAGGGRKGFFAAMGKLKGEMPKPAFAAPEAGLTGREIELLFKQVEQANLRELTTTSTQKALDKVLFSGEIPQPRELELLEDVFGGKFIKAILDKRSRWAKFSENFLDIIGLPKASEASCDISGWLRQGGPLVAGYPKQGIPIGGHMAKYFLSDKVTVKADIAIRESIKASKWAELIGSAMERNKFYLAPFRQKAARLAQREESFMTRFAKYLPFMKWSERSFVVGLNKLRVDVLTKNILPRLEKSGVPITQELVDSMCVGINYLTGRGSLGTFNKYVPQLNAMFFSPRLQASRFQILYHLAKAPRPVQKEIIRSIASFTGACTTIASLAALSGKAKVELDPRSTDWGKIRIGNTRLDPWAGFQQWGRFIAQLVTATRKITSTGGTRDINRESLILRMIRSKEAPFMGLLHDLLVGRTFIGEEMELEAGSVAEQTYNRLAPLAIQDLVDCIREEGLIQGSLLSIPAFLGWGIVAYPDTLVDLEAKIGQKDDEGNFYTLSDFSGDIGRMGYTSGADASPLVMFRFDSEKQWDKYYAIAGNEQSSRRLEFRKNNPRTDGSLFFWGKVKTLQSDEAQRNIEAWMKQYGIPKSALPALAGVEQKETIEYPSRPVLPTEKATERTPLPIRQR